MSTNPITTVVPAKASHVGKDELDVQTSNVAKTNTQAIATNTIKTAWTIWRWPYQPCAYANTRPSSVSAD